MRNSLIYRLSNETGEYAVRTRFVEVFHNTNGGALSYADDYFGVYTLMEKIKRDDDRVPVAEIGRRDTRGTKVTVGYMFKKDRLDPGDSGFSVNSMGTFGWVEPKEDEVHSAQQTWLQGYLNEISRNGPRFPHATAAMAPMPPTSSSPRCTTRRCPPAPRPSSPRPPTPRSSSSWK